MLIGEFCVLGERDQVGFVVLDELVAGRFGGFAVVVGGVLFDLAVFLFLRGEVGGDSDGSVGVDEGFAVGVAGGFAGLLGGARGGTGTRIGLGERRRGGEKESEQGDEGKFRVIDTE